MAYPGAVAVNWYCPELRLTALLPPAATTTVPDVGPDNVIVSVVDRWFTTFRVADAPLIGVHAPGGGGGGGPDDVNEAFTESSPRVATPFMRISDSVAVW